MSIQHDLAPGQATGVSEDYYTIGNKRPRAFLFSQPVSARHAQRSISLTTLPELGP